MPSRERCQSQQPVNDPGKTSFFLVCFLCFKHSGRHFFCQFSANRLSKKAFSHTRRCDVNVFQLRITLHLVSTVYKLAEFVFYLLTVGFSSGSARFNQNSSELIHRKSPPGFVWFRTVVEPSKVVEPSNCATVEQLQVGVGQNSDYILIEF